MLPFAGGNHHVKPMQADKHSEAAAAQAFFTAAAFFQHAAAATGTGGTS